MFYLLQTWQRVAFCYNVDELYSALSNRPIASAMIYSADNFEPLRHLAGISQHRLIECNSDEKKSNHADLFTSDCRGDCLLSSPGS